MRSHLLLTSALVLALGAGAALAQSTTGGTGSTTGSPSSTTTPSTTSTTPAPGNTQGTTAPMNTTPGATAPLPPAGSGTPPINPNTTSPTSNCVVGTNCATNTLVDPIPPSQCATGRNCFTSGTSAGPAGATRSSTVQPTGSTSPATGTPSGSTATTTATPGTAGSSFNAELCPQTATGGCATTGTVQANAISRGTRLNRVNKPAQTLTGRAIYDGKGQSIGQVANVELRKGRPTAVVVMLNDGNRVTLRSSRVVYLAANNALATRMTPAQIERLKKSK